MNSYRVELELRSGLGTPLAADTLWGHVAWGIRYGEGTNALEAWLARYDDDAPPLVISDPLPHGYFPRPALPPVPRCAEPPTVKEAEPPTVKEADERKRLDKRAWVGHEAWQQISGGVSPGSLARAVARPEAPSVPAEMAVTRAGINRLTGGTAQPEGGTLFTAEQTYFDFRSPPRFDLWCLSPKPTEIVRQWFEHGLEGGYGRDASAGLGHLLVSTVEEIPLPASEGPNACVLLGPAIPRRGDPYRGFFKVGVRCGRLGGEFAIGDLPGGARGRHKRPVRCLLAGTVLLLAQNGAPGHVGRVLRGAHPQIEAIRHYGMAPVLPCRLAAELLDHPLVAQPQAATSPGRRPVSEDSPS